MTVSDLHSKAQLRLPVIDALRGYCALAVIYLHISQGVLAEHLPVARAEYWVFFGASRVFDVGKIAVTIFFAISGFVVPSSLFNTNPHPIREFCVNRVSRIFPAYWLSVTCYVLVTKFVFGQPISVGVISANAIMLPQIEGNGGIIGIYWTLQIELVFYTSCIAFFAAGLLKNNRSVFAASLSFLAAAFALGTARHFTGHKFPVAIPLALSIMFWGFLWRRHILDRQPKARRFAWIMLGTYGLAMPAISILAYNQDYGYQETWYRYVLSYYAALAIFVLATSRTSPRRILPAFLGRISYSIYLFGVMGQILAFALIRPAWTPSIPFHAYFLVAAIAAIVIATASYAVVEAPAIALGRRINVWLDRRHGAATAKEITDVI